MSKYTLIILLWITCLKPLWAQSFFTSSEEKVPTSPNAASLGIFGAIPVGHYTGTPSISIPLYEIEMDGVKIPINISYHASGIRVNQEASWVGMGWALNAGGIITRNVQCGIDFGHPSPALKGYYYDTTLSSYLNTDEWWNLTRGEAGKLIEYLKKTDIEPDLYNFNFASYSGVMSTGKITDVGNSDKIAKGKVRLPEKYLDISYHIGGDDSWEIYDGKGICYYFGTKERTTSYLNSNEGWKFDSAAKYFNKSAPSREELFPYDDFVSNPFALTSSWVLDSIKSPTNKIIRFFYEEEYMYTTASFYENSNLFISRKQEGAVNKPVDVNSTFVETFSASKICQARLKRIEFEGGEILFNVSDRLDVEAVISDNKPKKLDEIIIKNNLGEQIKKIKFSYNYVGNTSSNYTCRLFLKEVIENDLLKHTFTYNTNPLPSKHSRETDFWGYYNAHSDLFPLTKPYYCVIPSTFYNIGNTYRYIPGQDKTVNPSALPSGILTSIQYPTKGKTQFFYEPHDYEPVENDITNVIIKKMASVFYGLDHESDLTAPNVPERDAKELYSSHFSVNKNSSQAVIQIKGRLASFATNKQEPASISIRIERKVGNSYENVKINTSGGTSQSFLINPDFKENYRVILPLKKGETYRMVLEKTVTSNYYYIQCSLHCENLQESFKGGGLRIKEIKNIVDGKQEVRSFSYKYPNGKSSGKCMTQPWYHRYWTQAIAYSNGAKELFVFFEGSSSSYTPFTYAAQGFPIGYSYVVEKNGLDTGYTIYRFHNERDAVIESNYLFSQLPILSDLRNGFPISQCHYNNQNVLVDSISYIYQKLESRETIGLRKQKDYFNIDTSDTYALMPVGLAYPQIQEVWRLRQEKKTTFANNQKLNRSIYYNTDNSYFITQGVGEDELSDDYQFPFHKKDEVSKKMVEKHMLEYVLDRDYTRNGWWYEGKSYQVTYKDTLGMILPDQLYIRHSTIPVLDKEFKNYNHQGNPGSILSPGNPETVYLWGYNGMYIVAEIKNATYQEVMRQLQSEVIQNLLTKPKPSDADWKAINSLRRKLPDAHITTFQYKPLVGVTSITDPKNISFYFEYDDLGRLTNKRDRHGNIIESYNYHYK